MSKQIAVGRRNGLDQESVIACDNIATINREDIGAEIGFLSPDQEAQLAAAIKIAFDLE